MIVSPGLGLPRDVGYRFCLKLGAFYCRAFGSNFHSHIPSGLLWYSRRTVHIKAFSTLDLLSKCAVR